MPKKKILSFNVSGSDRYYTIFVDDWSAPGRKVQNTPPDPGDISLHFIVEVEFDSGFTDVVTLQTAVHDLAVEWRKPYELVYKSIEDLAMEVMYDHVRDRWEAAQDREVDYLMDK